MTVKQKGNLTELQCITAFYNLGYSVSIPYGENSRYDFIADINGKLIKVQVKTSRLMDDGDTIQFSCRSVRQTLTGCRYKHYTSDDIDFFATYHNGQCYLVPVGECGSEKRLRFGAPKNNQGLGINYATDYALPLQLQKIIQSQRPNKTEN